MHGVMPEMHLGGAPCQIKERDLPSPGLVACELFQRMTALGKCLSLPILRGAL